MTITVIDGGGDLAAQRVLDHLQARLAEYCAAVAATRGIDTELVPVPVEWVTGPLHHPAPGGYPILFVQIGDLAGMEQVDTGGDLSYEAGYTVTVDFMLTSSAHRDTDTISRSALLLELAIRSCLVDDPTCGTDDLLLIDTDSFRARFTDLFTPEGRTDLKQVIRGQVTCQAAQVEQVVHAPLADGPLDLDVDLDLLSH